MSFGTFSAKYASEPQVSMDLNIEADHPFGTDDFAILNDGPISQLPPSAEPTITAPLELPTDIPWSLVIPAAVIGVVALGVGWYLTNGKKADSPI
jgi:hypothetical protein